MLQPLYDSEVYALKWESKSNSDMINFGIDLGVNAGKKLFFGGEGGLGGLGLLGGGLGLLGGGLGLLGGGLGLVGGGFMIKAIALGKQIFNAYKKNPFIQAFKTTQITGIFLAELIIRIFDNHFINLVGFSLGTQVIYQTIKHLKKRNKLHMINHLITMGGVADKNQMVKFLDQIRQKQQKQISISWTNVYCVTDQILSGLLKGTMPNINPIGLSEISQQQKKGKQKNKSYEIHNINVSKFINGHLTYRENLKTIATFVGLKDQ